MAMTEMVKPRPIGRPAKNGRRIGGWLPGELAELVNTWGGEFPRKTARVEALIARGLDNAPAQHRPINVVYAGDTVFVSANPPPALAARFMRPVLSGDCSITERLFELCHYGLQMPLEATG